MTKSTKNLKYFINHINYFNDQIKIHLKNIKLKKILKDI